MSDPKSAISAQREVFAMNRLVRFVFLLVVAWIVAGCGGDNDSCPSVNIGPYEFVITEWRFVNGKPVRTVLSGTLPTLATGVQFSLQARKINGTDLIPITEVSDVRFFRKQEGGTNFAEFKEIIKWPDGTVGTFFRIDQQFPKDVFEVRGNFKGNLVCKQFRVICPNVNPGL